MPRVTLVEFLSFSVGSKSYGIAIQKLQELRSYEAVTRIAKAPAYLRGVVNLCGTIVPIIDMRIMFGLEAPVYDQRTVVVVLSLVDHIVGIVVDGVSEVVTIADDIRPGPPMAQHPRSHVIGIGTSAVKLLLLLDPEQFADLDQLHACEDVAI